MPITRSDKEAISMPVLRHYGFAFQLEKEALDFIGNLAVPDSTQFENSEFLHYIERIDHGRHACPILSHGV
ncbi:MAG: hypothetical protein LBJ46_06920 [Planctomycetota bacterium]|jgi:hypothetical protein|nr:hypothetical protein [Planctomycetota bacterium]